MTGADLAAIRKAAGLSQADLARHAGIGRHAVSYWECKRDLDRRAFAVERMAGVLNLPDIPAAIATQTQWRERMQAELDAREAAFLAMVARMQARLEMARTTRRVRCGAKTRKGTPCRMKSEPGKRRCKFHGGKSTGARTMEGRARIAEAQRRRWAKWRTEREQAHDLAVTRIILTAPDARA